MNNTEIMTDTPAVPELEDEQSSAAEAPETLVELLAKQRGDILRSPGDFIVTRGTNNVSLLHIAVAAGDMQVAEALLDAGMGVDPKTYYGVTPLMLAAETRNDAAMEILMAYGADQERMSAFGLSCWGYYSLGGLLPKKIIL